MPRRRRIHVPGGFYHVTLRGNHRLPVFRRDSDRALLNRIVARAIEKFDARLHAYCWMSNHLHFLVQVGVEPLGRPMRQIAAEFARAMQLDLATTGHFFERRYHATLIEATDYLFTALHYIHRNPVEAGIVAEAGEYRWSSHHAYVGRRTEPWVTTQFILDKFSTDAHQARRDYLAFVSTDLDSLVSPFPEGASIFGSDAFIERIRGVKKSRLSNQGLQDLIAEACGRFGVQPGSLSSPARNGYLTKVRAWIAYQADLRGIASRSEVARNLNRSEGALRRAINLYGGDTGEPGCELRSSQPGTTSS